MTGSADEIGWRVSELAAHGITEIIQQPTGPDITDLLESFDTRDPHRRKRCGTRQSRIWADRR
ncbi:MAG: hypothetical protein ACLP4W_13290 [Mycobacterium sp.]|uniref:hypothetical protein n=1 Tax=Mycobacterium sp. TaxID=1785 RepID=UPI003F99B7B1